MAHQSRLDADAAHRGQQVAGADARDRLSDRFHPPTLQPMEAELDAAALRLALDARQRTLLLKRQLASAQPTGEFGSEALSVREPRQREAARFQQVLP